MYCITPFAKLYTVKERKLIPQYVCYHEVIHGKFFSDLLHSFHVDLSSIIQVFVFLFVCFRPFLFCLIYALNALSNHRSHKPIYIYIYRYVWTLTYSALRSLKKHTNVCKYDYMINPIWLNTKRCPFKLYAKCKSILFSYLLTKHFTNVYFLINIELFSCKLSWTIDIPSSANDWLNRFSRRFKLVLMCLIFSAEIQNNNFYLNE